MYLNSLIHPKGRQILMNLFYTNNITNDEAVLTEEEARHCTQVLRKRIGDTIHFVDGQGGFYEGEIIEANRKHCRLRITSSQQNYEKSPAHIHIAIAPTKNISRIEWFLEKATEIGISEVTPLRSHHSERKHIRLDRLQKIMLIAMKQSLKAYLPKLNELTTFKDFIRNHNFAESRTFIAHCHVGEKPHLKDTASTNQDSTILIGPEGDFSLEEVALALQHQYEAVTLGNARLRTETAGVAACHILNLINYK